MENLDNEISALKAKIEKYETQLESATGEDRNLLLKTINTRSETLNLLLEKEKALQSAGKLICCTSLPLNFISRTTMLLIFLSLFDYFLIFSDAISGKSILVSLIFFHFDS
jgi:hypothetical protein